MPPDKSPLTILKDRLEVAQLAKDRLEQEIAGLREAIAILKPVYAEDTETSETDVTQLGITDAIREVLKAVPTSKLTAVQVRDCLVNRGFSLEKYDNQMATIHQVLRRLVTGGEASSVSEGNQKTTFQWITPVPAAWGSVASSLVGPDFTAVIEKLVKDTTVDTSKLAGFDFRPLFEKFGTVIEPTAGHPAAKAAERIAAVRRTEADRVAAIKKQQGDK